MAAPRSPAHRRFACSAALLASAVFPPSPRSFASEVATPTLPPSTGMACEARADSPVAKPTGIAWAGAVTAQTLNTYLYRGFLTEENALIVQAWLDVSANVPLKGVVESIDVHGQLWNSFSDGITGTGGPNDPPRAWAEADWTLGATLNFARGDPAGGLSLDVSYQLLRAPNGNFDDLNEASLTLSYDDSGSYADGTGLFRGWNPSINLVVETKGAEDLSGGRGTYLGVGVAPTFAAWHGGDAPTFSTPILTGWSLSNYYVDAAGHDHPFGFLDIGVDLSIPLRDSGWSIELSAHGLYLGETPAEYAGNRDLFVVLTAGLSFAF